MFKNLKEKIENEKAESIAKLDQDVDESSIPEPLSQFTSNLIQFNSSDLTKSSSTFIPSAHQSSLEVENHRLRLENSKLHRKIDEMRLQLEQNLEDIKEKEELVSRNERLKSLLNRLEEDLREKREENLKLKAKCDSMMQDAQSKQNDTENANMGQLLNKISELEESIRGKNKTIRLQQQRISDIKKSFHKDLLLEDKDGYEINNGGGGGLFSDLASSSDTSPRLSHKKLNMEGDTKSSKPMLSLNKSSFIFGSEMSNDINFQYLRNVVFKFLICSDLEAQKHLIKAISVLLKFTKSEENQARDSLNYRMSWLKSLSLIGNGVKSLSTNK